MGKVAQKNRLAIVLSVFALTTILLISCQVRESTYNNYDADYEVLSGLRGVVFTAEAIPEERFHDYKIELTWYPRPPGKIKITRVKSFTAKKDDEGRVTIAKVDAETGKFTDHFSTPDDLRAPINDSEQPQSKQFITYLIESEEPQTRILNRAEVKIDAPRDCRLTQVGGVYLLPPRDKTWPCWRLAAEAGTKIVVQSDAEHFNSKSVAVEDGGEMTINIEPGIGVKEFRFTTTEATGKIKFVGESNTDIFATIARPKNFEISVSPEQKRFNLALGENIRAACKEGTFEGKAGSVYRWKDGGESRLVLGTNPNLFELTPKGSDWYMKERHWIRAFPSCRRENNQWVVGDRLLEEIPLTEMGDNSPFPALQQQLGKLIELNGIYNFFNRYVEFELQPDVKVGPSSLQNRFLEQLRREPSLFLTLLRTSKVGHLYVGSFKKKEILEKQEQLFIPSDIDLEIENTYHLFLKNGPS